MTEHGQVISVWLHCFDSPSNLTSETVITCLNQTLLSVKAFHVDEAQGPGIIIISDISPEICHFIHQLSRNGAERLLVLAVEATALREADGWRLLEAGASDVLIWNELANPGEVIAARFRRWQEVDELAESALVKNNLIGQSKVWKLIVRRVIEVARFTIAPVLLTGETGTGKELIARLIHALDRGRHQSELVILDCTTIVPELSGSELFGHERGAFTGAISARDGAFALANGGTLFLDEVGELPSGLQSQLLRVLQEHTFKRVGSNTWRQTDFRLVCATNRELQQEVAQGRFRRDLYYRLATWTITLPPLHQRPQDILPLVRYFMQQIRPGQTPPSLDEWVQHYFLNRRYRGNVRDLKNLVERIMACYVGAGPITIGHIPPDERPADTSQPHWCNPMMEQAICHAIDLGNGLRDIRQSVEEIAIRIAVDNEKGNLQRAAQKLGVTDRTLQKRRAEKQQQLQTLLDLKG